MLGATRTRAARDDATFTLDRGLALGAGTGGAGGSATATISGSDDGSRDGYGYRAAVTATTPARAAAGTVVRRSAISTS